MENGRNLDINRQFSEEFIVSENATTSAELKKYHKNLQW
jgi:hypothetical protein